MWFSNVIIVVVFLTSSVFAAEIKSLKGFDFYAAPSFGFTSGSYEAGSVDKGDFSAAQYGLRLGFKMGSILLGGGFTMMAPLVSSKGDNLSSADQIKYAMKNSKSGGSLGFDLGYYTDRVVIWGTYYPLHGLDGEGYEGITKYENKYRGTAFSAEINLRVWKRFYVGVSGLQQEFDEYSTTNTTAPAENEKLNPKISAVTYGVTISYLLPFSELEKVGTWFPKK